MDPLQRSPEEPTSSLWRSGVTTRRLSLGLLVLANLLPIPGIVVLKWDLFSILFFYWLESGVVGVYNVARMAMVRPVFGSHGSNRGNRLAGVLFFMIHYSAFMAGHGVFIFELFGPVKLGAATVLIGILALSVSHGGSFLLNFIGRKEYERVTLDQQMVAPYRRIMVMHVTIILCAFLLSLFGAPFITLMILVLLKIAIDVIAHVREHRRLGTYGKAGDQASPD